MKKYRRHLPHGQVLRIGLEIGRVRSNAGTNSNIANNKAQKK